MMTCFPESFLTKNPCLSTSVGLFELRPYFSFISLGVMTGGMNTFRVLGRLETIEKVLLDGYGMEEIERIFSYCVIKISQDFRTLKGGLRTFQELTLTKTQRSRIFSN